MPKPSTMSLMVVDDQSSMRGLTKYSLEQLGFKEIYEAADGQLASNELDRLRSISLIISDYNMPNMDGLQLLRKVRGHASLSKTPFIMITGRGDKELVTTAAKAGVNNYIVKPFNTETLKKKIEAVVGELV